MHSHVPLSMSNHDDLERRLNEIFRDKERLEQEEREDIATVTKEKAEFLGTFMQFAKGCILPKFEKARDVALSKNHESECKMMKDSKTGEMLVYLKYSLQPTQNQKSTYPELRFISESGSRSLRICIIGASRDEQLIPFDQMSPEVVDGHIVRLFGALTQRWNKAPDGNRQESGIKSHGPM